MGTSYSVGKATAKFHLEGKNDNIKFEVPNSCHSMIKEITAKDKISINQFIVSAVAEKISALETQRYLKERAARSSRYKFLVVLAKEPDADPED